MIDDFLEKLSFKDKYFMRICDLLEGEVIDFPTGLVRQKGANDLIKDIDFSRHDQNEMEEYVRSQLIQERDISIKKQKELALPTIMSMYNKVVKPTFAWAIQLDDVLHSTERDKKSLWIYYYGKDHIDEILDAARVDFHRLNTFRKKTKQEVKSYPDPERILNIIDKELSDSSQSVYLLQQFEKSTNRKL